MRHYSQSLNWGSFSLRMKRARIVGTPNQVVNWLYVTKGRMTKDAETKRNYFRLAVRESSDFGSTVNHPPIAVSTQWVWNSACKSARSLNAARAAASGSWSSAHALAAGKPRSRAPRPPITFAQSNCARASLYCLAPLRAFPYASSRRASCGCAATSS
jgi:hypothetical protein